MPRDAAERIPWSRTIALRIVRSTDESSSESRGQGCEAVLTIDAELIDVGEPAPRPGDMYIISLMLYKVLKVVHGTYPHQSVLVGHDTPDLTAPQFQSGRRHRLQLTNEFPPHASILNKFEREVGPGGIFFCTAFESLDSS
jgi:hypothetical protein